MLHARVALVVGTVGGTAACGEGPEPVVEDPPPLVDHFAHGQRLRAQYYELPGGAKLFRRFFDTELGKACSFDGLIGPSGMDTCVPVETAGVYARGYNFSDPACTVPAYYLDSSTSLVMVLPTNACDAEPALFEPGPVITHHLRDADGNCVRTPSNIYRGLGAPVALDRFVSAHVERDVDAGRVGALTLVGTDGSRQVLAGWDTERHESVMPEGELVPDRWTPRGIAYGGSGVFSDSSCTRPTASKFGSSALCPVTTAMAPLNVAGARLDSQNLFRRDDAGGCVPFSDRADALYFDIGEPIAEDAFPELTIVEQGIGRVRARDAASPEGTPILSALVGGSFRDTITEQSCELRTASDSVVRCLPRAYDGNYFADAGCTQRLLETYEPPAALVTLAEYRLAVALPTYVVRHVGMPYTPAVLYANLQPGCAAVPIPGGTSFFFVGDPIDPDGFEAASVHL